MKDGKFEVGDILETWNVEPRAECRVVGVDDERFFIQRERCWHSERVSFRQDQSYNWHLKDNPNKIQLTIFEDAELWLKDNLGKLHASSHQSVYPLLDIEELAETGSAVYFDVETKEERNRNMQDHVQALRLLCEQVGVTLYVGEIKSPFMLQDASNWDMEVCAVYWQLVMYGEHRYD